MFGGCVRLYMRTCMPGHVCVPVCVWVRVPVRMHVCTHALIVSRCFKIHRYHELDKIYKQDYMTG